MPKTIQVIRVDDPSIVIRDGVAIWEGEPIDIVLGDVIELTERTTSTGLRHRWISEWEPVDG